MSQRPRRRRQPQKKQVVAEGLLVQPRVLPGVWINYTPNPQNPLELTVSWSGMWPGMAGEIWWFGPANSWGGRFPSNGIWADGSVTFTLPNAGDFQITTYMWDNVGSWAWAVQTYEYTYQVRPRLPDTISPAQGTSLGGTTVRLIDTTPGSTPGLYDRNQGGWRTWVTGVRVGSGSNPPQATNLNLVDAKTIEFRTPAGTGTNVPVTFDYNIGSTAFTNVVTGRQFTYQAVPFAASVIGEALLASVTVTEGLTGAAQARIYWDADGAPSTYVTVTGNSPTATHTYAQPGQYRIRVLRVSDNAETSLFYATLPVAEWIFPAGGSPRGGELVTMYGQLMQIVEGVTFGGRAAANLNVVSSSELEMITPPHTGLMPVRLQTPYGEINTGISFLFRPLDVRVTGRGLDVTVEVVSGIEDTQAAVVIAGATQIVTPQAPVATHTYQAPVQDDEITVTRHFDMYSTTRTWSTMPYIDSITPERGRLGTVVQLEGGLFQLVEEVWMGGRQVEFNRISDTLIEVVADG